MSTALETKPCNLCKEEVNKSLFSINRANKDGLQNCCRACDKIRQTARRLRCADEIREYSLKYQRNRRLTNLSYRVQMLLSASKARALKKNREHTLTLEDIKELWPVDNKCPIFNIDFEWNSAGFRETSPSLDRIDSTKGYTKDNVQVISWKANRIKSYATTAELDTVVQYMKDRGYP